MSKFFTLLLVVGLAFSPMATAYYTPENEQPVEITTVASIPACTAARDGRVMVVNDAANATDCTTGAGTTTNICVCDGSATTNVDV